MPRTLLITLVACAGAALAAPAAQADVYCVKKPSCSGPGRHEAPDLATALHDAQVSQGKADVINLGAGEFATEKGFEYDAAGESANGVRIVGSGPKTVLKATTAKPASPLDVLTVSGSGAASTSVEDLAIRVPADGPGAWTSGLQLDRASAARVTVDGQGGRAMDGVRLGPSGELRSARVRVGGGHGVSIWGLQSRLEDVDIAGDIGVSVSSDGSFISRVRVRASGIGIAADDGHANVDNAAILLTAPDAVGLHAAAMSHPSSIAAGYLTVATSQPHATGVQAFTENDALAFVRLENSVVSGTETALDAYGPQQPAIIETHHSNYDAAKTKTEGAFANLLEASVTNHSPGFADVAEGDLRLTPSSELIDIGDPKPVQAAGTDAVRHKRVVGAAPDLGAYEYQALAPRARIAPLGAVAAGRPVTLDGSGSSDGDAGDAIAAWKWAFPDGSKAAGPKVTRTFARAGAYAVKLTVTDSTGKTGTAVRTITVLAPGAQARPDRTAPVITRLRLAPRRAGRRGRVRFAVSERAAVVVKVTRRASGGRRRVATISRTRGAGAVSLRVPGRLRRGRYRVVVSASDAAGNRATPTRRVFRVR